MNYLEQLKARRRLHKFITYASQLTPSQQRLILNNLILANRHPRRWWHVNQPPRPRIIGK